MHKDNNEMPKKNSTRSAKSESGNFLPNLPDLHETRHKAQVFTPKTKAQEDYLNKISNNTLTFAIGPAGTGKTFVAAMAAAQAFKDKSCNKIIITRPIVEAGEKLGYLPGDLNEKVLPYVTPFVDALSRVMGSGQVEALIQYEKIIFLPLAYMRGHSWDDSFVVLDEAQNVTKTQMKLFLTRIGRGTKVIVDGDISQRDIEVFGLDDALERLANVRGVGIQEFSEHDIIRSGIVRDILKAYSNDSDVDECREGLDRYLKG